MNQSEKKPELGIAQTVLRQSEFNPRVSGNPAVAFAAPGLQQLQRRNSKEPLLQEDWSASYEPVDDPTMRRPEAINEYQPSPFFAGTTGKNSNKIGEVEKGDRTSKIKSSFKSACHWMKKHPYITAGIVVGGAVFIGGLAVTGVGLAVPAALALGTCAGLGVGGVCAYVAGLILCSVSAGAASDVTNLEKKGVSEKDSAWAVYQLIRRPHRNRKVVEEGLCVIRRIREIPEKSWPSEVEAPWKTRANFETDWERVKKKIENPNTRANFMEDCKSLLEIRDREGKFVLSQGDYQRLDMMMGIGWDNKTVI